MLPEFSDKIADIFKTAVQSDLRNGLCTFCQEGAGSFQPVGDQVLDGGYAGYFPEKAAEILAVIADKAGQLLQGQRLLEVGFHVGNDFFVALDFSRTVGGEHFLCREEELMTDCRLKKL